MEALSCSAFTFTAMTRALADAAPQGTTTSKIVHRRNWPGLLTMMFDALPSFGLWIAPRTQVRLVD
eukprot:3998705-Amphidinium_carterae.1